MTISNPEDRKRIRNALEEISNSMTRIEAERDLIKEIKAELLEEYKPLLSRKQISKMAKVYHNQSFEAEVATHEEFEALYEEITGNPAS